MSCSDRSCPGLGLERLGYDQNEPDPYRRARTLLKATALAGALAWAYELLVDELFANISLLRESGSVAETLRIEDLPLLYRNEYGAHFAQKFLAVTIDLGSSLASGFTSPTCVAQELALRLVLDGVEALAELNPGLALATDWRARAEDSLFEDLDHDVLYNPSLDGISGDPDYAHLGMSDLNLSAWFIPFAGRVMNPYVADEETPDSTQA